MRLALALLREAGEKSDLIDLLEQHRSLVELVRGSPQGRAAFQLVLAYILRVRELEPAQAGQRLERMLDAAAKEDVMTTAEKLEARGRAEGEARGKAEGKLEALRSVLTRQLQRRFGEPSQEVLARISAAPVTDLERWIDRFATAQTLEEVFAPLQ
jgi:hypothetical protein